MIVIVKFDTSYICKEKQCPSYIHFTNKALFNLITCVDEANGGR